METIIIILVAVVGTVGVLGLTSVLRGYVLSILWAWFMVPIFHLPELTIVQAIGVSFVVSFFTTTIKEEKVNAEKRKSFGAIMMEVGIFLALSLFFGWVVKSCM